MSKNRKYLLIFVCVALIAALIVSFYLGSYVNLDVNFEKTADHFPSASPTPTASAYSPNPTVYTNATLLVDTAQLTSANVIVADGGSVDLNITFALSSQIAEETTVTLEASGVFKSSSCINLTLVPDVFQLKSYENKTATLKIHANENLEIGTYDMFLHYNAGNTSIIGKSGLVQFKLTVTHAAISNAAFINYWLDHSQAYTRIGNHSITVNCKNNGDAEGSFNVIATCVGVTFLADSTQSYQVINSTALKIPLLLCAAKEQSIAIRFIIDNDVDMFSISLQFESTQSNVFSEPPHSIGGMVPYIIDMRTVYYSCDRNDLASEFHAAVPS